MDQRMEDSEINPTQRLETSQQANHEGCWLCRYCSSDCSYMQAVLDFIRDSALLMSEEEIVAQVHENILAQWPDSGMTREGVRTHVHSHMVCPNMVAARSVREMSRIAAEVRECVVSVDQETGHRCVDEKMAKLYLSFMGSINGVLKGDGKRGVLDTGKKKT